MRCRGLIAAAAAVAVLSLGSSVSHAHSTPGLDTCGGTAPTVTACSTGSHSVPWIVVFEEPVPYGSFKGDIVMTIGYAGGSWTQRCVYTGDVVTDATADPVGTNCTATGSLPDTLVTFTQSCATYETGTTTPGGAGDWICGVVHA